MKVTQVYGEPALVLTFGQKRVLVVADLHLGLEAELISKGVALPSQAPKIERRLIELIEQLHPDLLIFLGDVKHNVPITSWQEWRELPRLFEKLSKLVKIEVVLGNHDGRVKDMIPQDVSIHGARGMVLGKKRRVGLMHGHAWPAPALLNTDILIMAHNHPAVEFRDELGGRSTEPVWLRGELDRKKFPERLRKNLGKKLPNVLVMPAFSELVGGAAVNRGIPDELLGPLFKSGTIRLEEAEVYLLDGTFLGKVKNLKGESTKKIRIFPKRTSPPHPSSTRKSRGHGQLRQRR